METLAEKIRQISTLQEKCIGSRQHELNYFVYRGQKSDFERVCTRCGDIEINQNGIYSNAGLLLYVNSKRFQALLKESKRIKHSIK